MGPSKFKEITCLVVDDDAMVLEVLGDTLKRRFKEVITAKNGEEGLEKFLEHKPDCVITDIEMPRMNGKKLLEKIREIDPKKPVVIVTAFEDEVVGVTSANAILIKPITAGEICQTVEEVMHL